MLPTMDLCAVFELTANMPYFPIIKTQITLGSYALVITKFLTGGLMVFFIDERYYHGPQFGS